MRHISLTLLCLLCASTIVAQPPHRTYPAFKIVVRLPIGPTHHAQICDGSEMASVHSRRTLGNVLLFGGLGAAVVSTQLANSGSNAVDIAVAGAAAATIGAFLRYNAAPSDEFWRTTVSQIKVGESRSADIQQCFGEPSGTMTSGSEATWMYNASKSGLWGFGGSARSLSVTMKDGVVTKVQKSEFGF